jgi:hypothetical protein
VFRRKPCLEAAFSSFTLTIVSTLSPVRKTSLSHSRAGWPLMASRRLCLEWYHRDAVRKWRRAQLQRCESAVQFRSTSSYAETNRLVTSPLVRKIERFKPLGFEYLPRRRRFHVTKVQGRHIDLDTWRWCHDHMNKSDWDRLGV